MKKTMKKTMAVVLAVVMMLSAVQLMSFALTIAVGPEPSKSEYAGEELQWTLEYENEAGEINGEVKAGEIVKLRVTIKGLHTYGSLSPYITFNKAQLKAISKPVYEEFLDDPDYLFDETGYESIGDAMVNTSILDATSFEEARTKDAGTEIFLPTAANSGLTTAQRGLCSGITWSTASTPSPFYKADRIAAKDWDGTHSDKFLYIDAAVTGSFGATYAILETSMLYDTVSQTTKNLSHFKTSVDQEITVLEGLFCAIADGDAKIDISGESFVSNTTSASSVGLSCYKKGLVTPLNLSSPDLTPYTDITVTSNIATLVIGGGETDKDPADYTELDAAIETAAAIDPTVWTAETSAAFVAALEAAIALPRDLTVDDQAIVNAALYALYDAQSALKCGHFNSTWYFANFESTCTDPSYKFRACDYCGFVLETEDLPLAPHDFRIDHVDSTCTVAGSETEVCKNCQAEGTVTELALAAHDYEIVTVDSTCTVAGSATEVCKNCQAIGEVNEFAFAAHEYEIVTVDSTCTVAGSETEVCKNCQATGTVTPLALAAHDYKIVTVDATYTTAGSETEVCKVCGATGNVTVLPMLASYKLTVETENCSVNVPNVTYVAQNAVTPVTITATPADGYEFAYWTVNGRIVSYDATYTAQVNFSYTLKAVCTAIDAVSTHTVTFVAFGKVLSTQAVEDGDSAAAPADPSYAGYTFTGWDVSIDSILKNTTVTAVFEKDTTVSFTVEAGNGVSVKGEANEDGTYAYNTKVVATFDESTLGAGEIFLGWSLDGTNIICYNQAYTFYVGSDVKVYAITGTEEIEALPTSSVTDVTVSGTTVMILTERNAPEGYTLVAAGVLVTKDSSKTLTVETAETDSSVIMRTVVSTAASGQYRLTVNVSGGATIYFTSFAIYTAADGTIVTVYGESKSV